ncbi:hypothetical protein ADICYQ_1034 [Cyclobacterium qasimii M12-11B]|uniref:Uncharacterized protein n=1 Tax=Cyclobacterium qasimii M12-11B TaxID=641524 RepID=S7VIX1_9BACT|nr:hypothetical protein ADICYQ_1034 [Cyclobacterium qasimii M12-11B]
MKLCWIRRFDGRGSLVIPSISQLQLAGIENQRNIPFLGSLQISDIQK